MKKIFLYLISGIRKDDFHASKIWNNKLYYNSSLLNILAISKLILHYKTVNIGYRC